jgi:hypothetical protein
MNIEVKIIIAVTNLCLAFPFVAAPWRVVTMTSRLTTCRASSSIYIMGNC